MAPSIDLALPTKLTRWIVLQKARRHPARGLRHVVGTKFQDLFHSPPGVLFTFPSLYLFAIDCVSYLTLAGGPAGFKQGFSCPVLLEKTYIIAKVAFVYAIFKLFHVPFQTLRLTTMLTIHSVYAVGFYAKRSKIEALNIKIM